MKQLVLFLGLLSVCHGSKILVFVPMPSRSHAILFEGLVSELAGRGHDVTYLSAYPLPKPIKNVREITLKDMIEKMGIGGNQNSMMVKMPPVLMMGIIPFVGEKLTDSVMEDLQVQELVSSGEKFDLIVGEIFIDEALLAGFSKRFEAPVVGVATSMANVWSNYLTGTPAPAAYVPDYLLGFTSEMTLCQRVISTVAGIFIEIIQRLVHIPKQDTLMKKYFGEDLPPLSDIIKNTSLVLVNHHYSMAYPRPYLPNMIEIGGYHVPKPQKLPKDLQKYMDESLEGVILFSMGSNFKSSEMPQEQIRGILKAFAKLKQNVLWKFETENLPDMPKNVKISKWLPQSDILAHSNSKLFITHGGQLSTTEAVVRGVPVVGIPVMADQHSNMAHAENLGFGKTLKYIDLSSDSLYETVTEVLNNPRYRKMAQERSKLLQDTPLPAMDTALFWIEYVIRHKGAPHFRSAGQNLAWYELYLVDVAVVLVLMISLGLVCGFYTSKLIYRKIFKKISKKRTQEKKVN